jgi:hypothetical protein
VHSEPVMALTSCLRSPSVLTGSADNTLNMFHNVDVASSQSSNSFLTNPRSAMLAKPGVCLLIASMLRKYPPNWLL